MIHTTTKRQDGRASGQSAAELPSHIQLLMANGPLGFNAGDTNLYRYVGDAPTDKVDPSGLSSRVTIGTIRGPNSADAEDLFLPFDAPIGPGIIGATRIHRTSRIVYRQVRGSSLDLGAGIWEQPGSTADGTGRLLTDKDLNLTEMKEKR